MLLWKVKQMVDAPIESQTTLYIINYLDWQREGQFTFDMQRAKLLDTLAHIVETFQQPREDTGLNKNLLPGGETIIIADIAGISEDLFNSLRQYTQNDTLSVGPWYIHLDGLLADGESYIRNLSLGRLDSERYNIAPAKVAILPANSQTVARLPQILRGFGIDAAFMYSDKSVIPMPFNWEAPDGTSTLMINYQMRDEPGQSIEAQSKIQADGPILWLHRIDSPDTFADETLDKTASVEARHSTLSDFVEAVRQYLPDEFRPTLRGELHLQDMRAQSGRFSARISYKQDVMRLRAKLNHFAEPLLALSLVFGTPRFPDIQKSLIEYSWRLLMQNMSPQTFAGAVNDDTYNEMTIRNRQVEDNSQRVIQKALQGLPGTPLQQKNVSFVSDETYIAVWNLHGQAVQQVVELELNLPAGLYPNILLGPDGEEQAFTWHSARKVIDFRASVAAVGYAVYTLKISKEKTAAYNQRRAVAGRSIGGASGESLGLVGGRLDWTFDNGHIIDLLNYYDGGDAGDVWQYQEPEPDVVMRGSIVDVVQVEATPTYERLIFRNRMRIAPELKDGKERTRGLRVLDLTTTATYYNGLPGIHFKTRFTNPAEDHRLRAYLRTGIKTKHIYTDSVFGLSERPLAKEGNTGDVPMQSLAVLRDKKHSLALFTRGLAGIEPIRDNNEIVLGLTLLRSVGWLNKSKGIKAAGAQMPGDFTTEFMLMSPGAKLNSAELLRTSMVYQAPLQAIQYSEKPDTLNRSYLHIEGANVIMSALKNPQKGEGLIVRLVNVTGRESDARLQADAKLTGALRLNLAGEMQSELNTGDNQVKIKLAPHEIATIYLKF